MKYKSLSLFAVALLGLTACGGGASASSSAPVPSAVSAAQLKSVTLRVGDQAGNSAQALLRASGELDNLPYTIQWSTFTSGPPMLQADAAGAIDVGQVGNTPPIFAAAANDKIDVVAAEQSPVGDAILVPAGSAIRTLADLRGKTIAVAQGSSANGTLLNTLAKAKLSPADVKLAFLQPGSALTAFAQHQVDAWGVWQPYVAEAIAQDGARQLITGQDSQSHQLSNGYSVQVASRASLADPGKNAAIADYVVRIGKAYAWAKTHQSQFAQLWSRETGLSQAITQAAVADIVLHPVPLDDTLVNSEQHLADEFAAAGQIPGKITFAEFVDHRYDTEIKTYLTGTR
ncbi:MAG TPA: ABC transporter substrate-binding protein [Pseudonocardiaceae bacterium]|nr:ABC transporter substrate-binding protein [Pseudonocardiaceae bacterium]